MGLVVTVVTCAVLLALLAGGRLRRLAALPMRGGGVLAAAVVVQAGGTTLGVFGASVTSWTYPLTITLGALLLAGFAARNPRLPGLPLVALGLALNATVVAANGAMPVSLDAAARAGISTGTLLDDARHKIAGPGTRLDLLSDQIPVLLPLRPEVVSPGDCLIAAGLGLLAFSGIKGTGRRGTPI